MKITKIGMSILASIFCILSMGYGPWTMDCPADEPVTLTLWELSAKEQLIQNLILKFERENPGIKVNVQQLTWEYGLDKFIIGIAAGNAPDICELGTTWISKFADSGALLDITEDTKDIKDKYFLWEAGTYNNKVYGIPWLAGTRVMFYNKELFLRAGLNPDKAPQTWEELLAAAQKIHDPKEGVWGFSIFAGEPESPWQEFLPFAWSAGGRILSADLKKCLLDSPENLTALEFYRELSRYSLIERQSQANELFAEGKVGMQISGSWNLRLIPSVNPQLNFGVAFVPKFQKEGLSPDAFSGGELFVITKKSRHPKEALQLIKFLTSKENVMEIVRVQQNVVPVQKEALAEPYYAQYPEQKIFLAQLNSATAPPNHPRWTEIQESITALVEEVIMKDSPPAEALRAASIAIDKILTQESKKGLMGDKLITAIALFIFLIAGLFIIVPHVIKTYFRKQRHLVYKQTNSLRLISPWLFIFCAFSLYPLIHSLIISFSRYDILTSRLSLIGLKNYYTSFFDKDFHRALWHTLVFCAGTVPFTISLALFCAVLINRKIPFRQLYQAGLFLPVTTSVVVLATVFTYIYSPRGLFNIILDRLGIIHPQSSWLNNPLSWCDISIPLLSIMAMNVWASFGYYTVLFLAGLQTIPENLYEVASLDGATEWQKFRFITFPQLKPIILLAIVINTIYSLQVFPEIFTMTMGGPLGSTTTAVYHLYDLGFHKFDMGRASSVAYILAVIIMIFSLLQMRLLKTDAEVKE